MRDLGIKKWCVVRESNPQPWAYKPLCYWAVNLADRSAIPVCIQKLERA